MNPIYTYRMIAPRAVVVFGVLLSAAALDAQQHPRNPGTLNPAHDTMPAQLDQGRRRAGDPVGLVPKTSGGRVRIQWHADGALRSASGFSSRAYSGGPHDVARAFLKEHPGLVSRVDPDQLQPLPVRRLGTRTYIRLQQHFRGIAVRGAQCVVAINASNEVEAVTSRLAPELLEGGKWQLTAEEAIARVSERVELEGEPKVEKSYFASGGRAVPAWRVVVRVSNPPGLWEYLISAEDGAVLDRQSLHRGQQPAGYAYPRNPTQGSPQRVALPGVGVSQTLASDQTIVYSYLPALLGQVAPNKVVQFATRQEDNFLYAPDDPRFSEVQLYYGMQRANSLFQDLGFPGWDSPLAGVVLYQDYDSKQKRFTGANNAYYSADELTPNGGLFFYLTPNNSDMSLDSDVIFHEYTHSIVEYAVGSGQSGRFQAINEGTADYFSDSFMNEPTEAEYAAKVFGLRTSFLRRADNGNIWPSNVVGEAHADGNIWSGALWDVRSTLGAAAGNNIAINAVASLAPDSDFYDAAAAAVGTAEFLYGPKAADVVAYLMEQRGIWSEPAQTAADSIEIGPSSHLQGSISAVTPGYLRLAARQYRVQVPNGATRLTISANATANIRFYIRYRVPVTVENGTIVAEQVSETGTSVAGSLTLSNVPELQTGTYYLAVVNTAPVTATYTIQAEAEGESIGKTLITLLENGRSGSGSAPAGPFLASRQFGVDLPAGTRTLRVALDGDQDVDLYIRFGAPVSMSEMGDPDADVVSASDSANEHVTVTLASGAPLPAGRCFLAVSNYSSRTAQFTIRATFE